MGNLRMNNLRIDNLRMNNLRMGNLRMGNIRMGNLRMGNVRMGHHHTNIPMFMHLQNTIQCRCIQSNCVVQKREPTEPKKKLYPHFLLFTFYGSLIIYSANIFSPPHHISCMFIIIAVLSWIL